MSSARGILTIMIVRITTQLFYFQITPGEIPFTHMVEIMLINKKRIRTLERYLPDFNGKEIILTCSSPPKKLESIGFTSALKNGEQVLPKVVGPVSRFNSNGKFIIRRDLPKEKAYRQTSWTWKQFNGRDSVKEVTETKEVEYERFQRDFISPPSVELKISSNSQGEKIVTTHTITLKKENSEEILHSINLMLEIFGECEVTDENLESIFSGKVERLNWRILPKGEIPWEKSESIIKVAIGAGNKRNGQVISDRLESIYSGKPDFVAIGQAGFSGYVVFGFPKKGIYILESSQVNNATYIFKDDWKSLSQLTKAEILNEKLHHARVFHRANWFEEIKRYL